MAGSMAFCGRMGVIVALLASIHGHSFTEPESLPPYVERTEQFDRDPGWEAVNNRGVVISAREVKQDFGYSATAHAGSGLGEIGGLITPDATPAYYAKKIPLTSLDRTISASGVINCTGRKFHFLLGFFNSQTLNEWRTPNTVVLRLQGRGDHFYAYLEYATSRWRAGGDSPTGFSIPDAATGKQKPIEFRLAAPHKWSLQYDPAANGGNGAVTSTIDEHTAICNLEAGHRMDGATFDRLGMLNVVKSVDDSGEVWLDDITVNGEIERFDVNPKWDQRGNRRIYQSADVRPKFDFGYSPTRFAGGKAAGEMGGIVYRGDGRYKDKMAWYADRIGNVSLDRSLHIRGKISLLRGVSDSTTLLGFFNSKTSTVVNDAQGTAIPDDFIGIAIEGPSSEGFLVYPVYRVMGDGKSNYGGFTANRILPDGVSHNFHLEYSPEQHSLRVNLDGKSILLDLPSGIREAKSPFDRMGILTTRIDGNAQRVYFDDLAYTVEK